nr:hypothetical protein [Tanacetum cinerariifolium]
MHPPGPNNTYTKPPSKIQILEFIKTLGYDEDPETKMIVVSNMVTTRLHQPWRAILSVLNRSRMRKDSSWDIDEFEWQTVERSLRPSNMSKLLYTRFIKLIIDYILSHNKSFPSRSNSKLHSSQHDQPITKLLSMTNGDYKFGMEVPDAMISDATKKKEWYIYYMAKKVESEKAKIIDGPEEQHVSLVKNRRGKGFMCYGDQVANAHNKLEKNDVPRKTRSLTIVEETVICELAHSISIQEPRLNDKLKGLAVDESAVQSLLELRKGLKASRLKSLKQKKQAIAGGSNKTKESANETDDADEFDMDLSDDNPNGDDDAARYGVFMHNKSTTTPNSTYLSMTVTSSSLDFIQTLLDETPAKELTEFMSLVYKDVQTTSVVHNPEGNPKLTSYISGASEQALDAQDAGPSFHKRCHDNQDSPNNQKGENKKNRRKDVGEPSSRSSRQNKSPVIHAQVDAPAMQPLDQEDEYVRKHPYPEWFPKKSWLAKRKTTWFDLLLKSDIDQNENHILGPHCAGLERLKQQYHNDVKLEYHVSQLKAAVLTEAKWNSDEDEVSKPRTFEGRMNNTKPHPSFYNDFYYLMNLSTKDYQALCCKIPHPRIDFFNEEMSTRTEGSVYSNLRIKSVVRIVLKKKWGYGFITSIVVKRSDDKEYEFSYADLPRLSLNDVEDIYLFQQTLNLTKSMMFFEGIDQKIPFTMSGTHTGVVYLNQHNVKSFMKLKEVKKFCDGTLIKIRENLVDMVKRNKLGTGTQARRAAQEARGQEVRFCAFHQGGLDDMDRLIGNLCTLWVGRLHLQANAERYERPPKSSPSVKLPSVKSYAPFTSSPSGSFVDAVKDIKNVPPHSSSVSCSPALVLDDTCVDVWDVSRQVTGRTKDVNSIPNLRTILTNEGFMDVKLSYLGGLWVMIELNSEETKMKLLQHIGVNSWFEELKPASQEFVCNKRIVWVDIEGIPLHLCLYGNNNLGNSQQGNVNQVEESDVDGVSDTIFEVSPQAPRVDVHEVNEKANSHHSDDPFGLYDLLRKSTNLSASKEDPSLSHPPRFTPVASHQDPIHSNSAHLEVNQDEPPIAKGSSSKSYPKASCFSQASLGNDSSADSSTHVSSRSTPKGGSILEVLDGMIKVGRSMGYDMEGCSKDIEQIISGSIGNSGGILCVWEETIFKKVDVSISDNFIALYGIWLPTNSKILIVCDGAYRVKDIRFELDGLFLPSSVVAIRWVNLVPIKVNIFAWRVSLDRLPTRAKMVAPLPLLEELSRAAESDVTNDQLIVLFEIEVAEDAEKVKDFRKLSTELREVVKRRYGYVAELRVSRSCDDALGTIEMLSHMSMVEDYRLAGETTRVCGEVANVAQERAHFLE